MSNNPWRNKTLPKEGRQESRLHFNVGTKARTSVIVDYMRREEEIENREHTHTHHGHGSKCALVYVVCYSMWHHLTKQPTVPHLDGCGVFWEGGSWTVSSFAASGIVSAASSSVHWSFCPTTKLCNFAHRAIHFTSQIESFFSFNCTFKECHLDFSQCLAH